MKCSIAHLSKGGRVALKKNPGSMTLKNYLLSTRCVHVRHVNCKGSVGSITSLLHWGFGCLCLRDLLVMQIQDTGDWQEQLLGVPPCTAECSVRLFDIFILNCWISLTFLKVFKIRFGVSLGLCSSNVHNAVLGAGLKALNCFSPWGCAILGCW